MSLRRSPRRAPAKEDGAGADTDLSCRLAGSGSLADALLGLSSLTLMLATWFLGVFFPIVLAGLYYLRWNVAFGILLAAVAASYAMDFQQSPGFVTFILKISYWFKHATMHVEPELAETLHDTGTMWCLHPHGMLMFSFILNGATRIYAGDEAHYLPGLVQGKGWRATGVAEPLLWKLPFIRSFLQLMGCAEPAGRESFKDLLRRRIPFGILPGGSEEIILLTRGKERIYIKHRKGFIKYALEQGYWLIPGYAFGESDTYWTPPKPMLQGFRLWLLRATKLIWPLTFGYWSPYIPLPVALDTVWGKPVKLPKIPEPTAAEVDKWHAVYIEAIKGVFERNKARFNCTDRELEIL